MEMDHHEDIIAPHHARQHQLHHDDDDNHHGHLHDHCNNLLKEREEMHQKLLKERDEMHQKEMEKLLTQNLELKEQLRVDKCALSLLNVLRENGDTIIVAERETNLISQGMKDLSERSEAVYLHLSTIAKDFCQKLDDLQSGIEKRGIRYNLPSPDFNSSHSNIEDFMEGNEILAKKLQDAERRLEEAEARNIELQESFEERLQTLSELGHGDTFAAPQSSHELDTSQFVNALQQETGLLRKDYSQRLITLSVRQGVLKPEEAYRQLADADALGDITLEDLKVMTPKKKTPMKSLVNRVFSSKRSAK
uniref:Uncharacterized protein n=1 Tax=Panagrolaimus sp. PS1159 TaxID=55785 RepID=A0AC35GAB8_9BILA